MTEKRLFEAPGVTFLVDFSKIDSRRDCFAPSESHFESLSCSFRCQNSSKSALKRQLALPARKQVPSQINEAASTRQPLQLNLFIQLPLRIRAVTLRIKDIQIAIDPNRFVFGIPASVITVPPTCRILLPGCFVLIGPGTV